jgi:hypothetical protein
MTAPIYSRIGNLILIAVSNDNGTYSGTIYPALPNIEIESLPSGTASIISAISDLRIDTVNGCNLDCVFCHSDFSGKTRHLGSDDFAEAMSIIDSFASLSLITLGCAYEPLLGKHFEELPNQIRHLRSRVMAEIVTNGLLLHKKDITSWVEFGLRRIHVSVFSHIDTVYERTGRGGGKFLQLEKNLLELRNRFPRLEISLTNPVYKENDIDLAGFCRWAFDYIGVASIDLRRAFFVEKPSTGYPAFTYTTDATSRLGRSPALTDDEWRRTLESCSDYMSHAHQRVISQGEIDYDSIVLRTQGQ